MPGSYGYRRVDEATYTREAVTRIMPQDLETVQTGLGLYILRMMAPPDSPEYAAEMATCVIDKRHVGAHFIIGLVLPREGELTGNNTYFNQKGFMIIDNSSRALPDMPEEIEMGYILGSTNAVDLEFKDVVASQDAVSELVLAR